MGVNALKIERAIKKRRETDKSLPSWWILFFIYILIISSINNGVIFVTFIFYFIIIIIFYYLRVNRVYRFIIRKNNYYNSIIKFTKNYAEENHHLEEIKKDLEHIKDEINYKLNERTKKFAPYKNIAIMSVSFGIYGFWILYKLNKIWYELQLIEQEFDDSISEVWQKIGLIKYPLNFYVEFNKERNFWLYLLLSFLTFGIVGLILDYKIHNDPDNIYENFHEVENNVLNIVREIS